MISKFAHIFSGLLLFFLLYCVYLPAQSLPDTTTSQQRSGNAHADSLKNNKTLIKSPKGAMLRSLALPGWGQLYNEKWFKSIIIAGTEVGLITNAIVQNQLAVKADDLLEKEFYKDNRNLSFWWLGATILYSMVDAYVDAHLYKFDEDPNLSLTLDILPKEQRSAPQSTLAFSLKYDF